jgi:O-antigen ligase
MGKYYPIAVAVLVTLGHITGLEVIFCIFNVLLAALALCVCNSIRPLYIVFITFSYQVTKAHSPAIPAFSDYYFTGWRLPVVIILGAVALFGIVYFIVKNRLIFKLNFRKTRLLLPLLALSAAFLLGGAFSETHSVKGLIFGATQVLTYLVVFMLFYLGLSEDERAEDTVDYLVYIALVVAYMLMAQMLHLFIFGDAISGGGINKDNINLGWATANPLGAIFVSLIPLLFYGAVRKKNGWLYLVTATLTWVFGVLTCSRNTMLFGTLIFVACLLLSCFKGGERKKRFIGLLSFGAVSCLVLVIFFRQELATVFKSFAQLGFDNNGRFKVWAQAWGLFCRNPLFGSGFFSIVDPDIYVAVEAMPTMAHNTIFELLAGTGFFGICAYSYYRIDILAMAFRRPGLQKTLLTAATLTVALQSLLDGFVFFYYPVFMPLAALAVLCRVCDSQEKTE